MQTRASTQLKQKSCANFHLFFRQKTIFPFIWDNRDNIDIQYHMDLCIGAAASHRMIQQFSKLQNQSNHSSFWTISTQFPQNRLVAPEKNFRDKPWKFLESFTAKVKPHWTIQATEQTQIGTVVWLIERILLSNFSNLMFQSLLRCKISNLNFRWTFPFEAFESNQRARFPLVFYLNVAYFTTMFMFNASWNGIKFTFMIWMWSTSRDLCSSFEGE